MDSKDKRKHFDVNRRNEKSPLNLARWDESLKDFLNATYEDNDYDDDKYNSIVLNMHSVLTEIINIFVQNGKFKDNWSEPSIWPYPFGLDTSIRSEKLNCDFKFGINEGEFYLETSIIHSEYLRIMNDEFWTRLLDLSKYGRFRFDEYSSPNVSNGPERQRSMEYSKSNIFKLMRNYVLLYLESDSMCDFGSLSVKWPVIDGWESLLNSGSQVFKILYQTNYSLWRASYLRNFRK